MRVAMTKNPAYQLLEYISELLRCRCCLLFVNTGDVFLLQDLKIFTRHPQPSEVLSASKLLFVDHNIGKIVIWVTAVGLCLSKPVLASQRSSIAIFRSELSSAWEPKGRLFKDIWKLCEFSGGQTSPPGWGLPAGAGLAGAGWRSPLRFSSLWRLSSTLLPKLFKLSTSMMAYPHIYNKMPVSPNNLRDHHEVLVGLPGSTLSSLCLAMEEVRLRQSWTRLRWAFHSEKL